jgi:hypothetical protein
MLNLPVIYALRCNLPFVLTSQTHHAAKNLAASADMVVYVQL